MTDLKSFCMTSYSFEYLDLRMRFIWLSRYERVTIKQEPLAEFLIFQRWRKVWPISQVKGISSDVSHSKLSVKIFSGEVVGSTLWTSFLIQTPTSSTAEQSKKVCFKLPVWRFGHNRHLSLEFLMILATLFSVGSIRCRIFQSRLVTSLPKPFSRALLQTCSHFSI